MTKMGAWLTLPSQKLSTAMAGCVIFACGHDELTRVIGSVTIELSWAEMGVTNRILHAKSDYGILSSDFGEAILPERGIMTVRGKKLEKLETRIPATHPDISLAPSPRGLSSNNERALPADLCVLTA